MFLNWMENNLTIKILLPILITFISSKRSLFVPIESKFKKKWNNSIKNDKRYTRKSYITKRNPNKSSGTIFGVRRHKEKNATEEMPTK